MRTIANAENDAALGGENELSRLDAPDVRKLKLSRRSALFATEKYAGLSGRLGLLQHQKQAEPAGQTGVLFDAPDVRKLKLSRRSALFATEKYAGLSGRLGLLLVLLLWCRSLSAAEKSFVISGVTISLEEVSSD